MIRPKHVAVAFLALACLACSGVSSPEGDDGAPSVAPAPSSERPARGGGARRSAGRRGGGGGAAPAPAIDSPAYRTFETEGAKDRLVFTSDTQLKKTWANMTGSAVIGTWSQSGDTVEVVFEPASHHGSRAETYVTRGECTLIRTVRVDAKTGERIESPKTFTADEPRCHPR